MLASIQTMLNKMNEFVINSGFPLGVRKAHTDKLKVWKVTK